MSSTDVRRTRRDPLAVPLKVTFPFWVLGSILLVLFPLYLIFMVSFAPGAALFGERPQLVVTDFTLRWWREAFESANLVSPLIKSLIVASVTTLLAIIIASPAAYVISRFRPASWSPGCSRNSPSASPWLQGSPASGCWTHTSA
jgi:ABC-type glycerol-3-phosphate transport system permease component